jgi:hypothetical protein
MQIDSSGSNPQVIYKPVLQLNKNESVGPEAEKEATNKFCD